MVEIPADGLPLIHEAEEAARRSPIILCVTGLVLDGDKVVLIRHRRRAWELPGGKLKAEDGGDWRVALSREIREETGLVIPPRAWSVVDVLTGQPTEGAEFPSTIIVARASAKGALTAGDDAADAGWFTRDDLPSDLSKLESKKALQRWVRSRKGTLEDIALAYCDAVNNDQQTTAEDLFEHLDSLARYGM